MTHPFRTAVEAKDFDAMVAALSPDVVLHSPVTFSPFEGREAVTAILRVVFDVFEDFTYTDELTSGPTTALVFTARGGRPPGRGRRPVARCRERVDRRPHRHRSPDVGAPGPRRRVAEGLAVASTSSPAEPAST
jgi:hypothetical protein